MTPNLKTLAPDLPISGYGGFIGSYLLSGVKNAIVDPGPASAAPGLLAAIGKAGLKPGDINYVILTHIHIDHAGGTGALIKNLPNSMVIAHSRARPHLIDPSALWNASQKTLKELAAKYGPIEPIPGDRIIDAADRMPVDLGGLVLDIYLTPGHAAHHLSLFDRVNKILLAGEAAGVCIHGLLRPATPPPFKLEEMLSSIDRLIRLAPEKICYGHFGCYDDGLARLERYREKLLLWYQTIKEELGKGTRPDDLLWVLRKKDSDLAYLDGLGKDEYDRELVLLNNSIYGMGGISHQAA